MAVAQQAREPCLECGTCRDWVVAPRRLFRITHARAGVSAQGSLSGRSVSRQVACDRVVEDLLGTRDFDADESSELPLILMPLVEDALGAIAPATGAANPPVPPVTFLPPIPCLDSVACSDCGMLREHLVVVGKPVHR